MKKILVVEDDLDLAAVVEARLRANGYEIIKASDGLEALIKAREQKPHMIVLDVSMPVMDGYQFLQEMKWDDDIRDIPVVVLTARANAKKEFDAVGIEHFLLKPFDAQVLLGTVSQCVGH